MPEGDTVHHAAKHLLTRFDTGITLRTHLKMEGTWQVHPLGTRWRRPGHTARVILRTATTEPVGFQVTLDLVRTTVEDDLGKVDPLTPVGAVPDLPAIVAKAKQLLEADKDRPNRVTTGDRRRGYQLWVYGRRGPCLRCGTRIAKADQGPAGQQRPTFWCPTCQPPLG